METTIIQPQSTTDIRIAILAPPAMELRRAILLYSTAREAQSFATVHDCASIEGKSVILAGRAMSAAMSRKLATKLSTTRLGGGFLPANVLMSNGEYLVWHEPPQTRHLAFKASSQFADRSLGKAAGRVPTPGTIFVAGRNTWHVFAYQGHERPLPQTPLFHAPFFNVNENGSICVGNVTVPKSTTAEQITQWNDAFFRSYFVHANYAHVVNYPGDVTGLWRDLLDGKHDDGFPESTLKPHNMPLSTLIQHLEGQP